MSGSQHWHTDRPFSRREWLLRSGVGFGGLALAGLLAEASAEQVPTSSNTLSASDRLARDRKRNPLSVRPPHFSPRAKRVIFLFMHGGPSQVDTFDYKPQLTRDHGKPVPFDKPRVVSSKTKNLLKSPWKFKPHGECGFHVSELFPEVARHVDDICFINSVHGSNSRHGAALLELSTGSDTFVRPSIGSWLCYGLGSENRDLPGFITICPSLTHGGSNNWGSAFLPPVYQGTPLGNAGTASEKAKIPFITGGTNRSLQRMELDLLQKLNQERLLSTGSDPQLEGRIESFELAFRMQNQAPRLQDISDETRETLDSYGVNHPTTRDFGLQCLLARRFSEAGVRFVQISHSYKWDQHSGLTRDHARNAREVDQPISALLTDLKNRGLLEDTIVWWGGEFGRTPVSELNGDGRDHNPHALTQWFCGGGFKGGFQHGETDEYGYYAVRDKVHFHDLHATILHQMGFDHTKLTYRYAGRDFRLTDVHGEVVHDVLA
ncbi:MAG: DUF1501 domain-containing protein [Planctomycetota bacterium]|nr:DUF1501 domain-containing protein [Planctomycetota bacterium]